MNIKGNSIQKGIPAPEEPKEINNELKIIVNGKEIETIKINPEKILKTGDYIFKQNGKWYIYKNKR